MPASRHRARELAVQMCYQWELNPHSLEDAAVIQRFWVEQAESHPENRTYFEKLVRGVAQWLPSIDTQIEETLENWKMSRVEKVDLAVLRVGVFELLYLKELGLDKIDVPIVINEAVEIAKKFGTAESAKFVNGVLDALARRKGLPLVV